MAKPDTDEFFICSCCGNQITPHTTTSWRTDDGRIVSLSQYAEIAAVVGPDETRYVVCVDCYRARRFSNIDEASIHLQAGRNFQLQNQYEAALTAFGDALAVEKTAEIYAAIGACQRQAGRMTQSAEAYGAGLSIDRHDPLCLSGGIELFLANREIQQAAQWLAIAAEAQGPRALNQPHQLLYRAELALLEGDIERGNKLASEGAKLIDDPDSRAEFLERWRSIISSSRSS